MIKIAKRINLIGDTYGDFTVLEMLYGYRFVNGKPRTYCRCVGVDGNEYIIRADALRTGATKHIDGAGEKSIAKDISGQRFGHLLALYPTDIRSSNGGIMWRCQCDCGNEINVQTGNLIRGHTRSCGHRHRSQYEEFIYEYLTQLNITFETEYRFENCRNSNGKDRLPFDFYLPDYNAVIEYDGQHYFEPVKGWGGEEKFLRIKENDSIKNSFCEENNINILRISYGKTYDEIKNMINSFLNPVTITVA